MAFSLPGAAPAKGENIANFSASFTALAKIHV
jgi:hypothetical protein